MRMELAFSEGIVPAMGDAAGCNHAGGVHHDVVGYATIDVVRNCSSNLPNMPEYWAKDLAYDNVLTGDAQQVSRGDGYAHGSPLVHIRAVPEGGWSEAPFSHTFYSRFQSAATPKRDGRQPLPSRFAARWREEGGWFDNLRASLNIWREPLRAVDATCATYADNAMDIVDPVIFDDAENAFVHYSLYFPQTSYTLPATSRTAILDDDLYPSITNGATSGWVYLDFQGDFRRGGRTSSNWVVVTEFDDERHYGVAFDATALGNGCSPRSPQSEETGGDYIIGPSENRQ